MPRRTRPRSRHNHTRVHVRAAAERTREVRRQRIRREIPHAYPHGQFDLDHVRGRWAWASDPQAQLTNWMRRNLNAAQQTELRRLLAQPRDLVPLDQISTGLLRKLSHLIPGSYYLVYDWGLMWLRADQQMAAATRSEFLYETAERTRRKRQWREDENVADSLCGELEDGDSWPAQRLRSRATRRDRSCEMDPWY